jgi:hypothetical protein
VLTHHLARRDRALFVLHHRRHAERAQLLDQRAQIVKRVGGRDQRVELRRANEPLGERANPRGFDPRDRIAHRAFAVDAVEVALLGRKEQPYVGEQPKRIELPQRVRRVRCAERRDIEVVVVIENHERPAAG